MASVKWIKIVTDVFDDEKILMIETMPECDSIIVIWFKLLCLAGKQNNSGVFQMGQMPYTDEMFAAIFRRPLNTVRLALNTFERFGMIEIVRDTVTIPNWSKHQSLDAYEKRKERDRLYQAERRAAQRAIAEKSSDASADTSSDVASLEGDIEGDKDLDINIKRDMGQKPLPNTPKNKNGKSKSEKDAEALVLKVCELLGKHDYSLFTKGTPELQNAIVSFVDFRKGIKKPMTDHAIDLLIQKLKGMTTDIGEQVEILNQSIMNGWQGIFPLKENYADKGTRNSGGRKEKVPAWMNNQPSDWERKAVQRMMGNDPEIAERAERLKKQLQGG